MKILTQPKLDNNILDVITQGFNWKYQFSLGMYFIFQDYPNLCQFYYRNDRNKTGHLLESVELHGKFINENETSHMLRGNIAAPSLKILWKNLNSVKCYDKSNMNVFTLSQCENFRWGLIYFDQFILPEGLNRFNGAPTSLLVQMWIKTHRCLVCMKDPKLINASSPRTYKSRYKKMSPHSSATVGLSTAEGSNTSIV